MPRISDPGGSIAIPPVGPFGQLARAPAGGLRSLLAGVAWSGLVATLACAPDSSPPDAQRVVLITLDTLRYDAVFAGAETSMPNLRAWSDRAAAFESFYAATASTQPSHASMFTGLHPWEHGLTANAQSLSATVPTVVERLRGVGFSTSAVVASFPVSATFGFDRGFDHFDDRLQEGALGGEWSEAAAGESGPGAPRPLYSLGPSVARRALEALVGSIGDRQFFWFHFFDPHSPYGDAAQSRQLSTPAELLALAQRGDDPTSALALARERYEADARSLDESLANLLSALDAASREIETHIVIVGDHGESFGEHGSLAHGRRLIESQLRVPCLIRSPSVVPGPRRDPAGSVDIAATLWSLAGQDPDPGIRGRDLTQVGRRGSRVVGMRRTYRSPYPDLRLDGETEMIDGLLFYAVEGSGQIVRGNRQGLTVPLPGESQPSPQVADQLPRLFASFEDRLTETAEPGPIGPEEERSLRALGYLP